MKNDFPQWKPNDNKIEELKAKQLSPTAFFELFFDDELFDFMFEETNRYALQHNKNLNVTKEEIKCFIGTLLQSGYVSLPRQRFFWETTEDTTV